MQAGLSLPDPHEALELLKRLDVAAESARSTLSEFLELIDAEEKFYSIGIKVIYGDFPDDIAIFPLDQALETLSELKETHQLALVTVGHSQQQLAKMKKAGIDSTIFSKIMISEDRAKKPHYQKIIEELGFLPQDTFVCGDRVVIDLLPAKELGCHTIHMRWGRGLNPLSPFLKDKVDFTITELTQIKEIIANL